MNIVVFDTNIIYRNWYLRGSNIALLERHTKLGESRLVVPEIVVLETKNLFRREVEKHLNPIKDLIVGIENNVHIPNIDEICENYDKALDLRLVELNADRPTHIDIPHDSMVSRSLAYRKPFRESDKGYRDTLLWEVILRKVVSSAHTIFLISQNIEDFGDQKSKQLHPQLVEELTSPDSVFLYTDLKTFIDEQIIPGLKQATDKALENLQKGQYQSFSLETWFQEQRDVFIKAINNWVEELLEHEPELENPQVNYIEDPEEVNVENVYSIDDDRIYIDATVLSDTIVDVFILKSQLSWLSDDYSLEIMEGDWNRHYAWAQITLKLPIEISLIFNILSKKVEEFEVNQTKEIFGWCQFCGNPILSDAAETCSQCGKSLI